MTARLLVALSLLLSVRIAVAEVELLVIADTRADEHDGTRILSRTVEISKGDPDPADAHDLRGAGGHVIGQSMNRTLRVAGRDLTGAMYQSEGYANNENAFAILFGNIRLDGAQNLNASYQKFHNGEASVADGVRVKGRSHRIVNVMAERLKGYAIIYSGGSDDQGAIYTTGRLGYIGGCHLRRCFGGVMVEMPDVDVVNMLVEVMRDYGVWAKNGNIRIQGGHYYGCELAAIRLGIDSTTGACQVSNADFSDSPIGCDVRSVGCKITSGYSQGCSTSIAVRATRTRINDTTIAVNKWDMPVGVEFYPHTQGSCLNDCMIAISPLNDNGAHGVKIRSHAVAMRGLSVVGDGSHQNMVGVEIDNARISGRVYTIDYAYGFSTEGSVAVDIVNWGTNNTLYVSGLLGEGGLPPGTAGSMVKISAAEHAGNTIYVNGVKLDNTRGYTPRE